jgi:Tol biopolymer transport system component
MLAVAICAAGLAGACVPLAAADKDDLALISRQSATDGGAGGDDASDLASVSADGRYVAFESDADNLSGADANAFRNVFVRDTQTDVTTLVSRQSSGAGGAGADGGSFEPSISGDGRYVAFYSDADNLSNADSNSFLNVFVRDTQAGTTTLVSRQSSGDGGAGADNSSFDPSISADGRYVAYASQAANLSTDDNPFRNVFVRDTQTNTTTLVSRQSSSAGGAGGDAAAFSPSISADGRYIAFDSQANNLSSADNNSFQNVFVRDRQAHTTTLVSRQGAGAGADDSSFDPSISADGRYVAFRSEANNLSSADENSFLNVFVRDTQSNTTSLVSRLSDADGGAGADADSQAPSISGDGRYVAFYSDADNLSSADDNSHTSVFVRDRQVKETALVSRQSGDGGGAADDSAFDPAISADGRYVAFDSQAANLSSLDSDPAGDVFLRDVLGTSPTPPTPPPPDTTAPKLDAHAKAKQKLGKRLKLTVGCDEACTVDATATAKPKGHAKRARKLKFKPASAELAAGSSSKLKLKPSKKTARKLKAAAKAKASIKLTATDAAGNSTGETLKVKLR